MDYLTSRLDSTDPENRKWINWYENLKKKFDSGEISPTEFEEALMQYFDWIEFRIPVVKNIPQSSQKTDLPPSKQESCYFVVSCFW